jgi:8-oxo-dGTP pyrophosphatase MutT (NUDIX family)
MLVRPDLPAPNPPHLSRIQCMLASSPVPADAENAHAAVALVLAGPADDLSLCLIRRAEHASDRWSGHAALPGGRVDPIDLNSRAAAIRETREEVGLQLELSPYLGSLGAQRINRNGIPGDSALWPHVFHLGDVLEPLAPNYEVAEAYWVPLRHLLDARNAGYRPTPRDGAMYDSPAVLYQGLPIWGLTYRVLTVFFERLELHIARPGNAEQ